MESPGHASDPPSIASREAIARHALERGIQRDLGVDSGLRGSDTMTGCDSV
jgi:hypothetical protein